MEFSSVRRSKRFHEKKLEDSNHPLVHELLYGTPKRQDIHITKTNKVICGKFGSVEIGEVSEKDKNSLVLSSPLLSLDTPSKGGDIMNITNDVTTPSPLNNREQFGDTPTIALKTQLIKDPNDINDISYHEVLIHKALMQTANYCPGFTRLYDWYREEDKTEKKMYMKYVMEQGGIPLQEYSYSKEITFPEYKSIVLQVLFTLYVGQKECQFMHNDIHSKNILIKKLKPNDCGKFHLFDSVWYAPKLLVKITDFGHSRVTLKSGRVIYNNRNPITHVFNPHSDIEALKNNISSLKFPNLKLSNDDRKKKKDLWYLMGLMETTDDIYELLLLNDFFSELKTPPADQRINFLGFGDTRQKKYIFKRTNGLPVKRKESWNYDYDDEGVFVKPKSRPKRKRKKYKKKKAKRKKAPKKKKRHLQEGISDFELQQRFMDMEPIRTRSQRKMKKYNNEETSKPISIDLTENVDVPKIPLLTLTPPLPPVDKTKENKNLLKKESGGKGGYVQMTLHGFFKNGMIRNQPLKNVNSNLVLKELVPMKRKQFDGKDDVGIDVKRIKYS